MIETHHREIDKHLQIYQTKYRMFSGPLTETYIYTAIITRGEHLLKHMILEEMEPGTFFYKGKQQQIELSQRLESCKLKYKEYVYNWSRMKQKVMIVEKTILICQDQHVLEAKQKKRKHIIEIKEKYNFPSVAFPSVAET